MIKTVSKYILNQSKEIKQLKSAKLFLPIQALLILTVCLYLICCLLKFRGNVIDIQFLPIKLPPVHGPPFFYKSTYIALYENHCGNCSGLMVPTSKILGKGSPPIYAITVPIMNILGGFCITSEID